MIYDESPMTRIIGQKPIEKSKINHILIRATNWVGDTVMTIPALEAVRENFPASRLTVLAKPWVMPLLENHPAVDEVLPFRKGDGFPSALQKQFHSSSVLTAIDIHLSSPLQG